MTVNCFSEIGVLKPLSYSFLRVRAFWAKLMVVFAFFCFTNVLKYLFCSVILEFPRPQTGPQISISWKRGFRGPKFPISPRSGKGSFPSRNPLFFYKGTHRKWGFLDRKLPFPARVRAKGSGGFWTPKRSFPGNGDSGPCLGSGESQVFFEHQPKFAQKWAKQK